MISLKKYLDMTAEGRAEAESNQLLSVVLESYRSALRAIGSSGFRSCPAVGSEMQQKLESLQNRLTGKVTPTLIQKTEKEVEEQLQQWGGRTSEHFKAKANEVKELLMVLARTAESVGERDQRYANHFSQFTTRLQTIADLEDLTQVRASLVKGAGELKTYVDQMALDSHQSVSQLRAEVSTYETKLKAAEELALRDGLTGLANRRNVEERLEWRIEHQQNFCVIVVDLNRFKQINDTHGHLAGDSLLKQFSHELRSNLRSSDIAGRWGGDEFIVVLDCDLNAAKSQIERMRKWVLGEYTIPLGEGKGDLKVSVDASIGAAQWQPGETIQQVIERADAAMYKDKRQAHAQGA
ncbi:MAG: GGDEF domain-containing protein [Terriglobales bacterium]